jgi:hypothetical protein
MKYILLLLLSTGTLCATAQTMVNKSYPVKANQKISFRFDYPKLVRISTWDKNEVSIQAKVSINNGANDDAFELSDNTEDGTLQIRNKIRNMDQLPRIHTIYDNGKKITFNTREGLNDYIKNNNISTRTTSDGVDLEITMEIKVPANMETSVKAIYGLVELSTFNGPITIDATYGGIDAAVTQAKVGKLTATTNYGQIYSNLDLTLTDRVNKDFHTSITAEPGQGAAYKFVSPYGNIYLRKQ